MKVIEEVGAQETQNTLKAFEKSRNSRRAIKPCVGLVWVQRASSSLVNLDWVNAFGWILQSHEHCSHSSETFDVIDSFWSPPVQPTAEHIRIK